MARKPSSRRLPGGGSPHHFHFARGFGFCCGCDLEEGEEGPVFSFGEGPAWGEELP